MKVTIGHSPELIKQAQAIRYQVFTLEQAIPAGLDLDGQDNTSIHALVTQHDAAIATARLTVKPDGSSNLARIAVLEGHRGAGIASEMINALTDYAQQTGVKVISIHAHNYLKRYYQQFGFHYMKDVEVVAGHQLVEMQLNFPRE